MPELILLLFAFLVGLVVCAGFILLLIVLATLLRERNEKRFREQHREELRAERSREFQVVSCWDRFPKDLPYREEASTGFEEAA